MNDIRALLFDLDGTLADTAQANAAAYQAALAEAGIRVEADRLAQLASGRHWRQFLPELIEACGAIADPAAIADRKKALYAGMAGGVRLNTALLALLSSCRDRMRCALVTTASRANVDAILDAHGLRASFDAVVTGDDVSRHKPDPQAYLLAADRLDVAPSQCLVFEDSDIGLRSARAAGMAVVRVAFADEPT